MKFSSLKAAMLAAALAIPSAALADSGSDFLTNAAKGDNAEIKMGKLAQNKGASAGIRRFGAMLVKDHTMAKGQVAALASTMSVSLPASDVKPDAQQAYDKISQLSGPDFDREFINHMVQDHQQDIADFSREADANDGKVSQLAAKQLPVLKKHLTTAQSLQGKTSAKQSMQPPQRVQ